MAKAKYNREVSVTLTLSEKEAIWLRSIMQNPIASGDPVHEHELCRDMRQVFWEALADLATILHDIEIDNDTDEN